MRLIVEWLVFKRLMPKMAYIFVEEQADKLILLGRVDGQDLIHTYLKSQVEEENLFFVESNLNLINVYKVDKIDSGLNINVTSN